MSRHLTFTACAVLLGIVVLPAGPRIAAAEPKQSKLIASSRRKPAKPYRFIYNRDGCSSYGRFDGDAEKWVEYEFHRLDNSPVDLLAWCFDGGNTAEYDSDILEHPGDADRAAGYALPNKNSNGVSFPRAHKALTTMIREGNDPPKVIIKAARNRGIDIFVSYRLNDIHDSKGTFDKPAFPIPEFAAFKRKHPEWLLGDMTYRTKYGNYNIHSGWSGVRFSVPEVRELKLAIIKEYFDKYDFDGLELDFTTHTPYFLPNQGYRLQYVMTDFVRTVRKVLDERAKQRGRRIVVAAHVFESPQENALYGFDIPRWVNEGLVDILTIGRGNHLIDIEAFQRIVKDSPVRIYACVYRPDAGYDVARGWASGHWQQKVDGIYTFNWGYSDPEGQAATIKQIGNPEILRHQDKTFRVEPGMRNPVSWKLHGMMFNMLPIELLAMHSGTPLVIPLRIGDDLPAQAAVINGLKFQMRLKNATKEDSIEVKVNGTVLSNGKFDGKTDLIYSPRPSIFRPGQNNIALRLVRRDPVASSAKPLIMETIQLHVDYR